MCLEFPGINNFPQIQVSTNDFESWIHYTCTVALNFTFKTQLHLTFNSLNGFSWPHRWTLIESYSLIPRWRDVQRRAWYIKLAFDIEFKENNTSTLPIKSQTRIQVNDRISWRSKQINEVPFLCFLLFFTLIRSNLSKTKLFYQSQRIQIVQGWMYI